MLRLISGIAIGAFITYRLTKDHPERLADAENMILDIRDRTVLFLESNGWTTEESEEMADQLILEEQ